MSDEKKKLTTAEILAAARKKQAGEGDAPTPPAASSTPPSESSAAKASPSEAKPATPKPAAKPAAGGARPSVQEMLAMARKKPDESPAPAAEAKPAAPKPAAKPVAKPAASAASTEAKPSGPAPMKDTASILAAARNRAKPGPVTKEEAAAREKESPVAPAKTKPVLVAPPMPPKPEAAKPKAKPATDESRRTVLGMIAGSALAIGMTALWATGGLWTLATARFMFANILTEPPSRFKVGFPANFAPGQVETKFVAQFGVWVVNYEYKGQQQLYALRTVCTHLGCTPNWLEAEQKFKCPCHGSGFYKDGVNFEGPAPRPLERYAIRIADDGQVEIDKSKLFQEEMGAWADPASFIGV